MIIETASPVTANSWNLTSRCRRRTIAVRGYSLIELLVVIAIIAILAAIAIPQVFAYRAKAVDAAMHSDLKNAALAMESYYALYRSYPSSIAVLTASGYVSSPGVGVTMTILTPTSYTVTALASGGTQASFTLNSVTGVIN
jgi:type IV pilus assembly protein PilA